jgi:hypothetical protein
MRVRPGLLRSAFVQTTTLSDILSDPGGTLESLRIVPGVGETSVARTRQAVFAYLDACFPVEWAASGCARDAMEGPTAGEGGDPALVARFRALRHAWGYSENSLPVTGVFHGDYTSPGTTVFSAALTSRSPFVYAPESLPEILKTPAVFKVEQGWSRERAEYLERLQAALAEDIVLPKGSMILLDRYRLGDLVDARGQYAGLSREDVAAQLSMLARALCGAGAPRTLVTDFRKSGLSSGFATAEGPLFHYCFGGYLELRGREILDHFHARARSAAAVGVPIEDWFAGRALSLAPVSSDA